MINIAILGAGGIARVMAKTLNGMAAQGNRTLSLYAVAARDGARAAQFAAEHNIGKVYGSYAEMLSDPAVHLVYIATPHSHHAEHIRLCLEHGKHVLCEKAFTVNAAQAEAVTALAREKELYLAEAIWTRYMPYRKMVDDLLSQGVIGTPHIVTANLAYPIEHVERIQKPELAGGALLDVGVYTLNFASMVFGNDIAAMASTVQMLPTGVDREESITLTYADGRMAVLCASAACAGDRHGVVYGSKGTLEVDNINNPQRITLTYRDQPDATRVYTVPEQITGFEYQVQTAVDCIGKGLCECEAMPHAESVTIMRQMDALRAQWRLVYPFE